MAIAKRNDLFIKRAKGQGFFSHWRNVGPGSATTAAAGASGGISLQLHFNSVGTTLPGTLVGFPLPPSLPNSLFPMIYAAGPGSSAARGIWLARIYLLGTLNLAATGDQFTHNGTTFPVTRTQLGAATQPLSLLPIIYITTATTTTAAVFTLKTAAGGTGYVDQDGNNVVGTITFTMPNAATTVNSAYLLRLEDGDSGVRDIAAIQVNTAASAGAASIFGAELIAPLYALNANTAQISDLFFGGIGPVDLKPAVETGGSALTSHLVLLNLGVTSSNLAHSPLIMGVLNA